MAPQPPPSYSPLLSLLLLLLIIILNLLRGAGHNALRNGRDRRCLWAALAWP